jgi:citrate synthase
MREDEYVVSGVDWADLSTGTLYVRDKTLNSMIESFDFIEAIYHTWLHKIPTENEKKMLNAVLVSFCGGWGIVPPVVFSARLAATTRAPIAQCLAAGFSASGPAHTSAIEEIMKIYTEKSVADIEDYVHGRLAARERIPGFGHPVLPRDPRPQTLRKMVDELELAGEATLKFDIIQDILSSEKGIYGNIDGINGAILIDIGFAEPSYGPAFFLMGRSLSMTAHILEEYKRPPFHALNIIYPGYDRMGYEHARSINVLNREI